MIAAHVVLGAGMGLVALYFATWNWPVWLAIWYVGLLCSEALLLGVWTGLSSARWWIKLLGLAAGMGWLTGLSFAPSRTLVLPDIVAVLTMHGTAVLGVALCFALFRWRFAKLERRSSWAPVPVGSEVQFSLRSMIALTVVIALLLALGRIIQWVDQQISNVNPFMSFVPVALVFALVAVIAALMLVWSCLGPGRIIVRGPTTFVGMMALSLVFPYYLGGPDWRFLIWPALFAVISAFAGGSLLVVRSCGYRLVPRHLPVLTVQQLEPTDAQE